MIVFNKWKMEIKLNWSLHNINKILDVGIFKIILVLSKNQA